MVQGRVHVTKPNSWGQRLVIADLEEKEAIELLKIGMIKIGWVYDRICRRAVVSRCYK